MTKSRREIYEEVKELKKKTTVSEICENCQHLKEFGELTYSLTFEE